MPGLSEKIRDARRKADLTQAELADALGVEQQRVSLWESGTRPSPEAIQSLEKVLGARFSARTKKAAEEKASERYVQVLVHYRRQKGWTVQQLAAASGLSDSVISGIENGKLACCAPWAKPLAKALGCSVEDIYCGTAGTQEPLGDLPASEYTPWEGRTTVRVIKCDGRCGWCGRAHLGLGCEKRKE